MRPYKDILMEDFVIREFDENIDPTELMWHRDKEDRIISSLEKTDWKFQMENKLPQDIKGDIFIPRGAWHRVIKGTGHIKIKIIKR